MDSLIAAAARALAAGDPLGALKRVALRDDAPALALRASQRTVQRALASLAAAGKAQSVGRGRARRWMSPPGPGFTTTL
ncbi:MAG TPA: hypothetical protein VE175_14150, partial [Woeseiaceae bacterium]|nr:hypothetical protein [Woeseiaceae bacterium]